MKWRRWWLWRGKGSCVSVIVVTCDILYVVRSIKIYSFQIRYFSVFRAVIIYSNNYIFITIFL